MTNPNASVQLLTVPWSDNYENLRWFANVGSQNSWFSDKVGKAYTGMQAVRVGFPFTVKGNYNEISKYNYMRFNNQQYSNNKWFYCFIERVEYRSEDSTDVYFKLDYFQTYLFNINFGQCFIERHHTKNDTVPRTSEPINVGEPIYTLSDTAFDSGGTINYLMVTSKIYGDQSDDAVEINGFIDGLYYFIANDSAELVDLIDTYVKDPKLSTEDIKAIYGFPSNAISYKRDIFKRLQSFSITGNLTLSRPDKIGDFTPRNKKTLRYPFVYARVSNNQGATQDYLFEDFSGGNMGFQIQGRLSANPTLECIPSTPTRSGALHSLFISAFPQVSYNIDYYNEFMGRHSMQLATEVGIAGISAVGAIATGGAALPLAMGAGSMALSEINQQQQAKSTANPAKITPGNLAYLATSNRINFHAYIVTPNENYAKRIDDYFTRFGYNVQAIGTPDPTNRSSYYYCQTKGAIVKGAVPQEGRTLIENALNKGCTFWRVDNIGNYDQSND